MKKAWIFCWMILYCLVTVNFAQAQEETPELTFNLSRDFGYASGTGDIQGTFSMRANGPDNLEKVVFLIDGNAVYEDREAPFRYQFNTDQYGLGVHSLSALGYTQDGKELATQEIRLKFVSAEEGGQAALRIVVPLFAVIFGLMALSYILPTLFRRRKPTPLGAARNYGLAGGTICKHCGRPFAFNLLSLRLLVSRLDRCPHCGKWGLLQRQPMEVLRAAEQAELTMTGGEYEPEIGLSDEEKLKKALDDSRYRDV